MATLSQRACGLTALFLLTALGNTRGHAQSADPRAAEAEQLFMAGRRALGEGDLNVACEKLAESFQLEAATGSLLALAVCHERQHKLQRAIAEYELVLSRSLGEERTDRARAALAKLEELRARLSTVTIYTTLSEETPTLTVRVNGEPVAREQLGSRLPVEGNAVLVEASAPGKQGWRSSVTISGEGQALYVTVPALVDQLEGEAEEPAPLVAPAPAAPTRAVTRKEGSRPGHSSAKYAGIALLSSSALGLGIAGGYTIRAAKLNRDSEAGCAGNECDADGRRLRLDARKAGTVASVSLAAGATLGVAGLVTYLLARRRPSSADRQTGHESLQASGWAVPGGAGACVSGSF